MLLSLILYNTGPWSVNLLTIHNLVSPYFVVISLSLSCADSLGLAAGCLVSCDCSCLTLGSRLGNLVSAFAGNICPADLYLAA